MELVREKRIVDVRIACWSHDLNLRLSQDIRERIVACWRIHCPVHVWETELACCCGVLILLLARWELLRRLLSERNEYLLRMGSIVILPDFRQDLKPTSYNARYGLCHGKNKLETCVQYPGPCF
jgi:hypothetical protein